MVRSLVLFVTLALGLLACAPLHVPVTPGPGEPPVIVKPEIPDGMVRVPLSGDIVTPAEACQRYADWRDALTGTLIAVHPDWDGTEIVERVTEAAKPWRPLLRQVACAGSARQSEDRGAVQGAAEEPGPGPPPE